MKRTLGNLALALVLVSCVSKAPTQGVGKRPELSFELASSFQPGRVTQAEIQKVLGIPDKVFKGSEYGDGRSQEYLWIYTQKPDSTTGRIVFTFLEGSITASSVNFDVNEDDELSDLKKALVAFKPIEFEKRELPWENPHAGPEEDAYENRGHGVGMLYSKARQKVTHIWWETGGAREKAEVRAQAPAKEYCIEDMCSSVDRKE